ncbi:DUF2029 domain-containing protein [bacterium]|nr:DUF2029 domain-containing protein [bacterium]
MLFDVESSQPGFSLFGERVTPVGAFVRRVLVVFLLVAFSLQLHYLQDKNGPDFVQDYAMAHALLEGEPIYGIRYQEFLSLDESEREAVLQESKTAHPPSLGVLSLPYVFFSYRAGYILNAAFSMIVLAGSVVCVARMLGFHGALALAIALLVMVSGPSRDAYGFGQCGPILSGLVLLSWCALLGGRMKCAGALLGGAMAMKLYPALFLFYFLFRREWSALFGMLLVFGAVVLVSVMLGSLDDWVLYLNGVVPFNVGKWAPFPASLSLPGFIAPLLLKSVWSDPVWEAPALFSVLNRGITLFGIVLVSLLARHEKPERRPVFLFAATVAIAISPITHAHSILIAVPAFLWVFQRARERKSRTLTGITLLLMAGAMLGQIEWWQQAHHIADYLSLSGRSAYRSELAKLHGVIVIALLSLMWREFAMLKIRGER